MDTYFGLEALQTNQNFKAYYGSPVFAKNTQELALFFGGNFASYFGLELGLEIEPQKTKNAHLNSGDKLPGNITALGATAATANSEIKGHHFYLGLYNDYNYIFEDGAKVNFKAMIGISSFSTQAKYSLTSVDNTVVDPASFTRNYSKTRLVPILKLSATRSCARHLGVRFSLNYRNLNSYRVRSQQTQQYELRFKDTVAIGLGVVFFS